MLKKYFIYFFIIFLITKEVRTAQIKKEVESTINNQINCTGLPVKLQLLAIDYLTELPRPTVYWGAENFLAAGQFNKIINSFDETVITKDNILDLCQTPKEITDAVNIWLNRHEVTIKYILSSPRNKLSNIKLEMEENNKALSDAKLNNWSLHSYIIPVSLFDKEKFDYCIQISGPIIRRGNIAAHYHTYCDKMDKLDIDKLGFVPTFQTASRIAHYLRLKDFLEKEKITTIETATTYGVRVPWCENNLSDDRNIVSIQKIAWSKDSGAVNLNNSKKYLNLKEILDLFNMIKYVGYWDNLGGNIFLFNNKLFILDLEQAGNSDPDDFFHKNKTKYGWNITGIIKDIARFIEPNSKEFEYFKNLVLNDPDLQQLPYYFFYQDFFNA